VRGDELRTVVEAACRHDDRRGGDLDGSVALDGDDAGDPSRRAHELPSAAAEPPRDGRQGLGMLGEQ
jgi:hypothetical protein